MEKVFTCECGAIYRSKSGYYGHRSTCSLALLPARNAEHQCSQCDRLFSYKKLLYAHIRQHHGSTSADTDATFACPRHDSSTPRHTGAHQICLLIVSMNSLDFFVSGWLTMASNGNLHVVQIDIIITIALQVITIYAVSCTKLVHFVE